MPPQIIELKPQPGPQTQFLNTPADIAIYGGSAGSGKSYGELLEPLRHCRSNKGYAAVIFRRTTPSIRNPGSIWDESMGMYGIAGGEPHQSILEWHWPNGGKVKFAHLEYDSTVLDWHGAQVPCILFDELTEFSRYQFFYMLSRNRSTCGVRPIIRATCNAQAGSWVSEFIAWWIDQRTGFPIPERAGKLRYFIRGPADKLYWADSPEELTHAKLGIPLYGTDGNKIELMPKSVTFIPASIYDNRKLLDTNPEYLASLLALPLVERERLLRGNWKIMPAAGLLFRRSWVTMVKMLPPGLTYKRGWDLAATIKTEENDPDSTATTKIGRDISGHYYVCHYEKLQGSPEQVERMLRNLGVQDKVGGSDTEMWIPQDPAQAGKSQVAYLSRILDGITCRFTPETGDKVTRFGPFSSQAEAGNIYVLEAPWNDDFFSDLEGFPDLPHDDGADSTSRAFNAFQESNTGLLDYMREEVAKLNIRREEAKLDRKPATLDRGGVIVKPPNATNVVYDLAGNPCFIREDGTFIVTEKHAMYLRKSGWKEVTTTSQ